MAEPKKSEIDLRYTEAGDLPYLIKWLNDPETIVWFPIKTQKEIEESARNWIGFSKYKSSLTALNEKNEVCGIATLFLMPYKKVAHHALIYFIIGRPFLNKGVGTTLMKNILHLARNYFSLEHVHIEVYEGCPILKLLEKFDFQILARQQHFVKDENHYKTRILLGHFFDGKTD